MKAFFISNLNRAFLFAIASFALTGNLFTSYSLAQMEGDSDLPDGRDLYDNFNGVSKKGNILDATNPMELMNRLRRATAMDNATSPEDAIDEALKNLEAIEIDAISK